MESFRSFSPGVVAVIQSELLPCPFCGSTNLELSNLSEPDDYFVSCSNCEIQQIANYKREEAIRRWNKRV